MLLFEREGDDSEFLNFLYNNCEEVLKLFDILENDQNYFSKREGFKTEYMLLVRNEYLRKYYTSDKERLKNIMNTVLIQNKGI